MSQVPYFYGLKYRSAFLANMAGRLRDIISEDCAQLLQERGVVTPVTDVSLILYVAENQMPSIAEIARALDFSHQRTASRVNNLEKLDLIIRHDDPQDTRCKRFCLSSVGEADFKKLQSVYTSASNAIDQLLQERGIDLMDELLAVSSALKKYPLSDRIEQQEHISK